MKHAYLFFVLLSTLTATAQVHYPDGPSSLRNVIIREKRVYIGFDLGGGYRNQVLVRDRTGRLTASGHGPELVPGIVAGFQRGSWSYETGIYNLPSTIAYSLAFQPSQRGSGSLGIQYAQVPLRVRKNLFGPGQRLNIGLSGGVAALFNYNLPKGVIQLRQVQTSPDTSVLLVDRSKLFRNFSVLLEIGGEVSYRLHKSLYVSGYLRQLIGVERLWGKEFSSVQYPEYGTTTAETRASGLTAGVGLRYHFTIGKSYRSIFD
ncbi:MAG: hypothetical protein J7576_12710 [Siphonobacter aquaeclarae]|nr:hypothetical protein [Siphonobacter aquaeclarae]